MIASLRVLLLPFAAILAAPLTAIDVYYWEDHFEPQHEAPLEDCDHRYQPELRWKLKITRVVGSPGVLNPASGILTNPAAATFNGLVSKYAKLSLGVYDFDFYNTGTSWEPFADAVYFNGEFVGTTTSVRREHHLVELKVPIHLLRFARRVPGAPVTEENAGVNEIKVVLNKKIFPVQDNEILCGGEIRHAQIRPKLQFDAMDPVVLVHGNNELTTFFDNNGFYATLADRGIPIHKGIQFTPRANSTQANSLQMFYRLPSILPEFGARWAHLIAHSKGGLDSRDFLVRLRADEDREVGILSLTTLVSPHMGSVLADYSFHGHNGHLRTRSSADRARLLVGATQYNGGIPSLTLKAVRDDFNPKNLRELPRELQVLFQQTRPLKYAMIGADANVDDSVDPIITLQETAGVNLSPLPASLYPWVLEPIYQTLADIYEVQFDEQARLVTSTPNGVLQHNDFAVTADSATLSFTSIPHPFQSLGVVKKNHANITDGDPNGFVVGALVNAVREAQQLQEFPFN